MESKTKIIDLTEISETFPETLEIEIYRSSTIDTIERMFENQIDVIFIEGSKGSGKKTLLTQFAKTNHFDAITHFVNPADRYSYDFEFFKKSIYNQVYFYINNSINNNEVDDISLVKLRPSLDKTIKRSKKPLYFIFDGLINIPEDKREIIYDILADLPWGKVKFLISGDNDTLNGIITSKNIKYKSLQIPYFSYPETKQFLKSLTEDDEEINEIYKISLKGLPEKLEQIKRICKVHGINKFLSEDITEKTNLLEIEWKNVENIEDHLMILSLLAFDDYKYNLESLSKRIKLTIEDIKNILKNYTFISTSEESISYVSEYFRAFAIKKLAKYKDKALALAIDYFIESPNSEDSLINLPHLYQRANRYKELINMLSIETFATLLQKHQSITTINQQFDYGLNASIEFDKYSANFMRFSLLKSSFKEIEKYRAFETEIDARIALNQPEEAYNLAVGAYLKEDRLNLLTELAKQKRENGLIVEPEIIDQIKELYKQVDLRNSEHKSVNLATNLLYSCPDLAIDLIEKISEDNPQASFKDIAYSNLSVDALIANDKVKDLSSDIELITNKIKDDDRKHTVNAIAGLLGDYNSSQIIRRADDLNSTSKKLFFLERWILTNKDSDGVSEVIDKALNVVISNSSDEEPSATLLSNIASPLPFIKDSTKINKIIELFDSQKNTIINPTEDYIKLQLILAKSISTYNYAIGRDRYVDIYMQIDEIKDLSTKTNCLASYWSALKDEIFSDTIENEEKLISTSYDELNKNVDKLLKDTAFHNKLLESVLKYITNVDIDLAILYISKVNTQHKRDYCYVLAIDTYIEGKKITNIDFTKLNIIFDLISNKFLKDKITVNILQSYSDNKEYDTSYTDKLIYYINHSFKIDHIALKCMAHTVSIIILKNYNAKEELSNSLRDSLKASWQAIDVSWYKVDIGFKISSDFAKEYPELAKSYLDDTIAERENTSLLDSTSVPETYILSVRLAIRAFSGLIKNLKNIDNEVMKLEKLISVIPSFGEQIRLWNNVALNFHRKGKNDNFKRIVREYVKPNLYSLGDKDIGYKDYILKEVSPSLFSDHAQTFFDYINKMSIHDKDLCLYHTCFYIMTKMPSHELLEFNEKGYELQYEEAKDICSLIEKMDGDDYVFRSIKNLVVCLKNHKLVSIQINDLKRTLMSLVENTFPKPKYGIKHNGYKIALKAVIYSLDIYNEKKWNDLKNEAYGIPNVSDCVFVLTIISEEINTKSKKIQADILQEAYDLAKLIPSNYDRFERYDSILRLYAQISKSELLRVTMEVANSLKNIDDEALNNKHSNLIDLLYQYDPANIDEYLTIIDNDIIKKNKIRRNIEKQIKTLKLRKDASISYKNIDNLERERDIHYFATKTLTQLNSGRISAKNIEELFYLLKKGANYGIGESYNLFSLYIENIVRKYEKSSANKNIDFLYSIFEATVFNANLIDILSQNNSIKIRNRLKAVNTVLSNSDLYYSIGERDKFETFLRDWVENNVTYSLNIIDPYFCEDDLSLLTIINELVPDCEVFILTSKEGNNNRHDNNEEVYKKTWSGLSDDTPPRTTVKIIWRENNLKSPFHDRWWIPDDAQTGLRFGTSYNSMGLNKDSELSIMTVEEAKKVESNAIRDYIEGNVRKYGTERLRTLTFELD